MTCSRPTNCLNHLWICSSLLYPFRERPIVLVMTALHGNLLWSIIYAFMWPLFAISNELFYGKSVKNKTYRLATVRGKNCTIIYLQWYTMYYSTSMYNNICTMVHDVPWYMYQGNVTYGTSTFSIVHFLKGTFASYTLHLKFTCYIRYIRLMYNIYNVINV